MASTYPGWLKSLSSGWVVCPVDLEPAGAVHKLLVDDVLDGKHLVARWLMTQPFSLGRDRRRRAVHDGRECVGARAGAGASSRLRGTAH